MEEDVSVADNESTSDYGDEEVVDKLDDCLAQLHDFYPTSCFEFQAPLRDRAQQPLSAGDAAMGQLR